MHAVRDRDTHIGGPTRSPIGPMAALFALFMLVLVGGAAFAAWKSDDLSRERQSRILQAAIAADLRTEALMARDYAWWDATIENAVQSWNQDWVDANIGTYLFEGFGYSAVLVLDSNHQPIGIEMDPDQPDLPDRTQLRAAIADMKPLLLQAASAPWGDPLGGAGLLRIDRALFMASAAPVTPEIEPMEGAPRPDRAILVLMKRLDTEAVLALGAQLLLRELSLYMEAVSPSRGIAVQPMTGLSNTDVAWFAWVPDRPGSEVISTILPWAIVAALGVVGLGVMILTRFTVQARVLARSVETLEAHARELEDSRRAQALALDRALESDRAKTAFLQAVSHELRSPLNAILGFTDLLRRSAPSGQDHDPAVRDGHLQEVERAGIHLLGLVNRLIEAARLEGRAFALDEDWIDLGSTLAAVLRGVEAMAQDRAVTLDLAGGDDAAAMAALPVLRADPKALRRMLIELLENAVRHSPRGGSVRVAVECLDEEVCLVVEDQGPGIPAEVLDGLGRPFLQRATERTEPDDAEPWGRPGLGLYLTGLMISIHGGRLSVSRGNPTGTIARLCFPVARVRPADMRSPVEQRMEDQLVSRAIST